MLEIKYRNVSFVVVFFNFYLIYAFHDDNLFLKRQENYTNYKILKNLLIYTSSL